MPDIDSLGKWPIVQFGLVALTLMAAAYAMWRGTRDQKQAAPAETRWFFDGPLNVAITHLRDIARISEETKREMTAACQAIRDMNRTLEEFKDSIDRAVDRTHPRK